ncbi:MAG: Ig-like domain-containing protein [Eubacterium sp.]|nr:Ig-like domain-containing protein [Eubacterium sp.]
MKFNTIGKRIVSAVLSLALVGSLCVGATAVSTKEVDAASEKAYKIISGLGDYSTNARQEITFLEEFKTGSLSGAYIKADLYVPAALVEAGVYVDMYLIGEDENHNELGRAELVDGGVSIEKDYFGYYTATNGEINFSCDKKGDYYVVNITGLEACPSGEYPMDLSSVVYSKYCMVIYSRAEGYIYADNLGVEGSEGDFSIDGSDSDLAAEINHIPGDSDGTVDTEDSNYTTTIYPSSWSKYILKLSKTKATIKVGKKTRISAKAYLGGDVTYKSSNKKVAKVTSKGVVKGVKKGTATIKVTADGVTKKFKVTVKK